MTASPQPADVANATVQAAAAACLQLSEAQAAVLRLLSEGALAPLRTFMTGEQYRSVARCEVLPTGESYPVPVVLAVRSSDYAIGSILALRDAENRLLGTLHIEEVFPLDADLEDCTLPVLDRGEKFAVCGRWELAEDQRGESLFASGPGLLRTREALAPFSRVIAIEESAVAAAGSVSLEDELSGVDELSGTEAEAAILLNLFEGRNRPLDFDRYCRLEAATQGVVAAFPQSKTQVNVIGLSHKGTNRRNLLLHALIHRNHGATDFLVSRSEAQQAISELGGEALGEAALVDRCRLDYGIKLLFAPAVDSHQGDHPLHRGLCVWLTGLSGAGKSSIARELIQHLFKMGRRATLLDGDLIRNNLSRGLSFSKEDRHINICRIGFVAAEIVYHEGLVVCAAVSPYESSRESVRSMMPKGAFVEIHVDTPMQVCESRDVKGFYAQARSGSLQHFTGVSDPYERPLSPELRLPFTGDSAEMQAEHIFNFLLERDYLRAK